MSKKQSYIFTLNGTDRQQKERRSRNIRIYDYSDSPVQSHGSRLGPAEMPLSNPYTPKYVNKKGNFRSAHATKQTFTRNKQFNNSLNLIEQTPS